MISLAKNPVKIQFCRRFCEILLSAALVFPHHARAAGGIATDGTLGAARTLRGANVTIPQSLGTTVGHNLFHSFARFNVDAGQTVTFTENTDGALRNVITRVTGNAASSIDGTLQSAIPNADFYFINPHGVTFGANAQVDVPGAFHVSTADQIAFRHHGGTFYATDRGSSLSVAAPTAFGFLAPSTANNGLIDVKGATLAVREGQTLDVVAGNISIGHHANLNAPGGDIRLLAQQGAETVRLGKTSEGVLPLPGAAQAASNGGNIRVAAGSVSTAGSVGGHIGLWGNTVTLDDGKLDASNLSTGDKPAGNAGHAGRSGSITLRAGTLHLLDGGKVSADTYSSAQAGSVTLQADAVLIDGHGIQTGIASESRGDGDAGSVQATVGDLDIRSGGGLSSSTYAVGDAGSVTVTADRLTIAGHSTQLTGIGSFAAETSSGNAGSVAVQAGSLDIHDGGGISSSTWSSGNAGNVSVTTGNALIDGRGNPLSTGIFSNANAGNSGNAGSVEVSADTLELRNGGRIDSDTYADAQAGSVTVKADRININGQGNATGIASETKGNGDAGTVLVETDSLDIRNGGGVSSSAYAHGNAGSVTVKADDLSIAGQNVLLTGIGSFAAATGSGDAGTVSVAAGKLDIHDGGGISSSTWSSGDAGDVTVSADSAVIDGRGSPFVTGIFSTAILTTSGNAGTVKVNAGKLELHNGGKLSSNTYSQGSAGTVEVDADTLLISRNSFITSAARGTESGGKTGNVNVTARDWLHLDRSLISIENAASPADAAAISPGTITITAKDIALKNGAITTDSSGSVAAGNIVIRFFHGLSQDASHIRTTAVAGDGGSIAIDGGATLVLHDADISTSVSGADGDGGAIRVQADALIMASGLIQANAVAGSGGDISLDVRTLIPSGTTLFLGGEQPLDWTPGASGFNVIQAASATGINGTLNVSAPQLNLSGVLANLGGPQFDSTAIDWGYCASTSGSSLIRLGEGGLPPQGGNGWMFQYPQIAASAD